MSNLTSRRVLNICKVMSIFIFSLYLIMNFNFNAYAKEYYENQSHKSEVRKDVTYTETHDLGKRSLSKYDTYTTNVCDGLYDSAIHGEDFEGHYSRNNLTKNNYFKHSAIDGTDLHNAQEHLTEITQSTTKDIVAEVSGTTHDKSVTTHNNSGHNNYTHQ